MDKRVERLVKKLDSANVADVQALVDAGFSTPQLIKAASDQEILAIPGIGPAKLAALRSRLG
jgi:hypothetical protein